MASVIPLGSAVGYDLSQLALAPLTPHLGVEISGVQLEDVAYDDGFIELARKAMDRHVVILMRGQRLGPGAMVHVASQWGQPIDIRRRVPGVQPHHVPGHDFVKVISNGVAADGRPLGDGNSAAQIWHSDSTAWEVPTSVIAFYCRVTPDPAPRTYFTDMAAVYDGLPPDLRERIGRLRARHYQYARQIEVEVARSGTSLPLADRRLGRLHPLVRRHLRTQRPFLYLPARRDSLIEGMTETESRALLDEMWEAVDACPATLSVALAPDDFVIWDNAMAVHRRDGWPATDNRVMWHVSVGAEVPTPLHPFHTTNVAGMADDQRRATAAAELAGDY
ncbi:TauD/TfdA family dioxygenase [Frankia sp. Cr2]|uniref:TauD/TfdA dioxygenase family protein n=1 Tax=Frankia sp. Cr2 TaxID=3073932 RepID=UPI002AD50ED9|nr:TauD/TfdA family dioxygenase [Frankia sp. Cr2]